MLQIKSCVTCEVYKCTKKKLFFSFQNYVQLRLCQSWLSNMSGIFSKLCLDIVEGSSGRKTRLLLFLMQCELIDCERKGSYKYLTTILLLTNHLEYLEEKEWSPYNSGPLCTRSDFLGVQKSESERTQISESMLLPVIQNCPQEPRPHSMSIWQKPRQVCRTWFCCFCFVSHVGCISGHPHTLMPDGQ